MASTTVRKVAAARGGRRETQAEARFTDQLVWLDTRETKERVVAMARGFGLSQSAVLRGCAQHGIDALEIGLRDGSIRPEALP
jgi:hypothetical protein